MYCFIFMEKIKMKIFIEKMKMKWKINTQTNKQPSNDSVSSTRLPRNCKNTKLEKVVRFKKRTSSTT